MSYRFRRVQADDLPVLRTWLAEPHVRRWWNDPDDEMAEIGGEIDLPDADLNIVSLDGAPFAYIQSWDVHSYDSGLRDMPPGTRGIDVLIGPPAMLRQGHGSSVIAAFTARLHGQGAPRVTTDPNPDNTAALRAYARAGFRRIDDRVLQDGPAVLMAMDRPRDRAEGHTDEQ